LFDTPHWLVWRYGKNKRKLPYDPETKLFFKSGDAWDKPHNWLPYEEAKKIDEHVGFVPTRGSGLYVIDLDEKTEDKEEIIELLDSYTERSPSGKGFHIFVRAKGLPDLNRTRPFECFSHNKWVTVTQDIVGGRGEIKMRSNAMRLLLTRYFPDLFDTQLEVLGGLPLIVQELLEKDSDFKRRWEHDFAELGFPSASEHEMSLLNSLFYQRISFRDMRTALAIRFSHKDYRGDRLLRQLEKASLFQAPKSLDPEVQENWTFEEMLKLSAPKYLLHRYLLENSVAVLFGQSGQNKSFLALDWSLCVSQGMDWHHFPGPDKARNVVYCAAEGFEGMTRRTQAWQHQYAPDCDMSHFVFRNRGTHITDPRQFDRFVNHFYHWKPSLVVFDTLNFFFGTELDENYARDMNLFMESCLRLREAMNCAIILVTHPPKGDDKVERGSSVLSGAATSRFNVLPHKTLHRHSVLKTLKQKDDAAPPTVRIKRRRIWHIKSCYLEPYFAPTPERMEQIVGYVRENPYCKEIDVLGYLQRNYQDGDDDEILRQCIDETYDSYGYERDDKDRFYIPGEHDIA